MKIDMKMSGPAVISKLTEGTEEKVWSDRLRYVYYMGAVSPLCTYPPRACVRFHDVYFCA
jgi:hypothetical protein